MCLNTTYFAEKLKTKKNNNKKVIVHAQITVHLPTCKRR